jgi:hypothetical protein
MAVARVDQYVDVKKNGKLDGYVNEYNNFVLTPDSKGVYDVFAGSITEEDYAIGKFIPTGDKDNTYEQFFKFWYNLTPACLVVPAGGDVNSRAQTMPAFVNAETDAGRRAALSSEMQGYRFIKSGQYTNGFSVRNNNGDVTITHAAGEYSADGKLMYGAGANAVETLDVPLGGDYNPIPPTYIYKNAKSGATDVSKEYKPHQDEANDWYIADVEFRRADWTPDYKGNLLYKFESPGAVFVSDPLVGENLPVAKLVSKASNSNPADKYETIGLNNYLGSFNPRDAVMLGVRKQELTTADIAGSFEGLSLFADTIKSGEHSIIVDSVAYGGFGTIPDASGLRRMAGPEDGAERTADSGNSSSSYPEFDVDLGIELPSLSFGITDFITVIIDGQEIGFSIGLPLFTMEKKAENYSASDKASGAKEAKYGMILI